MTTIPIQQSIAHLVRMTPDVMNLLPGGVWTRRIRRNEGDDDTPTPGATPEAFDHRDRIQRCLAILNGEASADVFGPPGAYYAFPELWLRCLPHDSEKRKLEEVAMLLIELLDGKVIPIGDGQSGVLKIVGRMLPDDDPDLPPAVVDMIRVQVDSVWSV